MWIARRFAGRSANRQQLAANCPRDLAISWPAAATAAAAAAAKANCRCAHQDRCAPLIMLYTPHWSLHMAPIKRIYYHSAAVFVTDDLACQICGRVACRVKC